MKRALTVIRLEVRLNRFQLVAVAVGCLVLALVGAYMIAQFRGIPFAAACTSVYQYPAGLVCPADAGDAWTRATQQAEALPPLLAILPWVAGLLVGVPAVGTEVETRTSMLAWTLGPSRWHWLLRRVLVLLPLVLVMVAIPAVVVLILGGVQKPLIDPLATFDRYQSSAIVTVARAALAFGIGLLVGAWLGRLLPALVIGGVIGLAADTAGSMVFPYLMPARVISEGSSLAGEQHQDESDHGVSAGLYIGYRLPDGSLVDWAGAVATAPEQGTDEYDAWQINLVMVGFGYPAATASEVALRDAAVTLLAAAACIGGSIVVIRRRRPY